MIHTLVEFARETCSQEEGRASLSLVSSRERGSLSLSLEERRKFSLGAKRGSLSLSLLKREGEHSLPGESRVMHVARGRSCMHAVSSVFLQERGDISLSLSLLKREGQHSLPAESRVMHVARGRTCMHVAGEQGRSSSLGIPACMPSLLSSFKREGISLSLSLLKGEREHSLPRERRAGQVFFAGEQGRSLSPGVPACMPSLLSFFKIEGISLSLLEREGSSPFE